MMKESNSKFRPPRFGQWILERIASSDIQYSALGDFEEIYSSVAKKKGLSQARKWYWTQVIRSIPPFLVDIVSWRSGFIEDNMRNAWNGFKENKAHSFINILSLAIGLFCCVVIMLSVQAESGYDSVQKITNRVDRLSAENPYDEGIVQASDFNKTTKTLGAKSYTADFSYPIDTTYLDSFVGLEFGQNSYAPRYEYLSVLVLIIMFITSFSFIKFTAIRSVRQSKKITTRITAEDRRFQLSRRLPLESLYLIFIVLLFGIILTVLTLFYLNSWVEGNSLPGFKLNITLYLGMILIVLCWINFWNLYCFIFPPIKPVGTIRPGKI